MSEDASNMQSELEFGGTFPGEFKQRLYLNRT